MSTMENAPYRHKFKCRLGIHDWTQWTEIGKFNISGGFGGSEVRGVRMESNCQHCLLKRRTYIPSKAQV